LARLRVFPGRELCRLLEEHGFVELRQRGSHIVMQKRVEESTVTVPVPNHPEIRSGTQVAVIVDLAAELVPGGAVIWRDPATHAPLPISRLVG
jgi:predicted RNA binding protein YcfA (HicA-like mRNA interferase family)